jgi:DNA-binding GntR family transcriptional regulator
VRFEVEAIAAEWAAERRDDQTLATLARHLGALEEANAAGNVKAYLRANYAFHFTIYRAAGSESMLKIIEDLWLRISPYFNMLHGSGNYSTANEHHKDMLSALRNRDAPSIRRAVQADIDAASRILVQLLD